MGRRRARKQSLSEARDPERKPTKYVGGKCDVLAILDRVTEQRDQQLDDAKRREREKTVYFQERKAKKKRRKRKTRDIVKGVESVILEGGDIAKALASQGSTKGRKPKDPSRCVERAGDDGTETERQSKRRKSVTFAPVSAASPGSIERKPSKRKNRRTKD